MRSVSKVDSNLPSQGWIDTLIRQHVQSKGALNFVLKTIRLNCVKCTVGAASETNGECKECKTNIMIKQISTVL